MDDVSSENIKRLLAVAFALIDSNLGRLEDLCRVLSEENDKRRNVADPTASGSP